MKREQRNKERKGQAGVPRVNVQTFKRSNVQTFILACLLTILVLLVLPTYGAEQSTTQGSFAFVGFAAHPSARAMGLNGAFTAVADDSTAPYWNSAGLATIGYKELSTSYTNLYELGLIRTNTVALLFPDQGEGASAINWIQARYDLDGWREQLFIGSYAKRLAGRSAIGLSLKHFRQTSGIEEGNARGWGIDVSGLAQFGRLRLGIALQDVYNNLSLGSGGIEHLPFVWRGGIAVLPLARLTGAVDVVGSDRSLKQIHLGVEQWFGRGDFTPPIRETSIGVRAGVAKSFWGKKRMTYAAGASVRFDAWQFDYAYLADNEGLGETHRFALGVRF